MTLQEEMRYIKDNLPQAWEHINELLHKAKIDMTATLPQFNDDDEMIEGAKEMKIIDLSAWQTYVPWGLLVSEGVEGVILKIGEHSNLDDMFVEHVNNAVKHGLKYGVYYYGHAANYDEAAAEADQVADWLAEYLRGETPELGIWYDAESQRMLSSDNVTANCMTFLNRLTEHGHQYNGIYASWNWLSKEGAHYIHLDELPYYVPIWVAQYSRHCDLKDEYPDRVRIWQYTDHYNDSLPYDANIYFIE